MKVLLVGFHKYDDSMYPHLKCFIDELSGYCNLMYFHFRERGYSVDHIVRRPFRIKSWIIIVLAAARSIMDLAKLKLNCKGYDRVVAIDHYAYALTSIIYPTMEVVFWSHDIIGPDHPSYKNPLVRAYMKLCSCALKKNKRIIIQDEGRLRLLKDSLCLDGTALDVFLMPVCLPRTTIAQRVLSSRSRPRIIQCGGIGAYRSSDKLLAHYQENFPFYRLYFHGFLFPEMKDQLARSRVQPMTSSSVIKPEHIPQLLDYCDIGFVSYEDEMDMNFFLVSRSSGQLVECLRAGLPVIVMGKNNLHEFVEEQGIGVGITGMSEMNTAIETIVRNYDRYSENCFHCFKRNFDSAAYFPRISSWMQLGSVGEQS